MFDLSYRQWLNISFVYNARPGGMLIMVVEELQAVDAGVLIGTRRYR